MRFGRYLVPALALNLWVTSNAFAGCADFFYTPVSDPTNLLGGWAIQAQNAPPGGASTEDWKEDHCFTATDTPGDLYKIGDGSAVDPRALRGTWTPNSDGTVTYNYGSPSTTYRWKLYSQRGSRALLCWEDADTGEVIATGGAYQVAGTCP